MALVAVNSLLWPPEQGVLNSNFTASAVTIDAAGEKMAWVGRVYHQGGGSKDITKLQFSFDTVVKSGGSGLTVSLQNISTTVGAPMVPDETQDQTVAIANGDASFATDTWITTAALSANRTVAFGEYLGVVVEFDGTGWQTPDSVGLAVVGFGNGTHYNADFGTLTKTGGSWANLSYLGTLPGIILEYTDGSFGSLGYGFPYAGTQVVQASYGSTGNPDERALKITMPFKAKCHGAVVNTQPGTNCDYDVVLYDTDGTTVLGTVSIDRNQLYIGDGSHGKPASVFFTPVTLNSGSAYRVSIKPTTTNAVIVPMYDLQHADHRKALRLSTDCVGSTRVDAGSWSSDSTTRMPFGVSLILSEIDDGSGGAAGGGKVFGG